MITLYIDGDACSVKEETYKVALRYQLDVFVVTNSYFKIPQHPKIHLEVVSDGPDIADDWIAEHVKENDIVITSDLPLADRCIKKKGRVLDQRGNELNDSNIGEILASREVMSHLRQYGDTSSGPPPMTKKHRSQFASKLDQIVQQIRRQNRP